MSTNTDLVHLPSGIKDRCRGCGEPWLNFSDQFVNGEWERVFRFEYGYCPECESGGKVPNPDADLLLDTPAERHEENQR